MNRPIDTIAYEILADWKQPNFAAAPYLVAMTGLRFITDTYIADSAKTIISYFLSNASTWRGEVARRTKAELKRMVK